MIGAIHRPQRNTRTALFDQPLDALELEQAPEASGFVAERGQEERVDREQGAANDQLMTPASDSA